MYISGAKFTILLYFKEPFKYAAFFHVIYTLSTKLCELNTKLHVYKNNSLHLALSQSESSNFLQCIITAFCNILTRSKDNNKKIVSQVLRLCGVELRAKDRESLELSLSPCDVIKIKNILSKQ